MGKTLAAIALAFAVTTSAQDCSFCKKGDIEYTTKDMGTTWAPDGGMNCRHKGCGAMVCDTCHENQANKLSRFWVVETPGQSREKGFEDATKKVKNIITPLCAEHCQSESLRALLIAQEDKQEKAFLKK